jgi:hypothetical protein
MKSKLTISTFELFSLIPDAETARQYIEKRRWPEGVICPKCKAKAGPHKKKLKKKKGVK